MNFIHEFVTEEIIYEVRDRVSRESLTPNFILAEYENGSIALLKWDDASGEKFKTELRFCAYEIDESEIDAFIAFMSGVILGFSTHCK